MNKDSKFRYNEDIGKKNIYKWITFTIEKVINSFKKVYKLNMCQLENIVNLLKQRFKES